MACSPRPSGEVSMSESTSAAWTIRKFDKSRGVPEAVLVQDALERTAPVYMAQFGAGNVVRDGSLSPRDGHDLIRRDEEELRIRVNKPPDEPGACNPVDLGVFPCDPFHGSLRKRLIFFMGCLDRRQRSGFQRTYRRSSVRIRCGSRYGNLLRDECTLSVPS